ncbi:MAG: hypothetical protein BWY74_00768 [Firmicutes bacterium ADurb.Bin419]|nr:MAG: hypothetical protein BWY74_00768 [Firmicutes bacterium ADurb.Bin419]
MNQKIFVQRSDEILEGMSVEELRSCLHNIARKTPENKREQFLQLLNDCCNQSDQKENGNKIQLKRLMSDEKVKGKLSEIKEVFVKIEDGKLCISANGYEDYSNGYWASDWIWEYEDNEGIGRIIVDAVLFAHDCVNDCRYEEALLVYKLVMDTHIFVADEWGGDSFELSLEKMIDERLVAVNLKVLALEVLYSDYQLQPASKRAGSMYSYFSYSYFKDIHIEEIFSVGREELRDTDLFFQSWIDFLMQQSGDIAARLLKESILYYKGTAGLVEMARQGYKEHPSVYLAALLEYEKTHDYEKMKKVGKEALGHLECDLKIRGELALKTAQASFCVNDSEFMKKCWYEAFFSNSTIPNYLRLFVDGEVTRKYKELAENRIEKLCISYDHNKQSISETAKNSIDKIDYKYLYFFSGHFEKIRNWCMEKKSSLGWSGHFIGVGIDLMLLYLYADKSLRKAGKKIAVELSNSLGFNKSKNLVFMKENFVFETDVSEQKGEEIFWNIFCLWKVNYKIDKDDIKSYVEWLEIVIDKRIDGIVGGKFRSKYNDVALLAAAVGEVKESLGEKNAKRIIIEMYLKKYSRHTAFRGALKEYMY